jgi:hypothetical protein
VIARCDQTSQQEPAELFLNELALYRYAAINSVNGLPPQAVDGGKERLSPERVELMQRKRHRVEGQI